LATSNLKSASAGAGNGCSNKEKLAGADFGQILLG